MSDDQLKVLLENCRKQDRASQRTLYEYFYREVFGVCLRYAGSREEAKELANDAFLKAFTHLDRFNIGGNFGGWLYRIALFTAIDRYRVTTSQNRRTMGEEMLPPAPQNLETQILDRIEIEEKLAFVQRLSPVYRTVFNCFVVEEMSHEEIADRLGISVGTSKSNLSKARNQLRAMLEKKFSS